MKYYSVDRRGVYAHGVGLALEPNGESDGNEIVSHVYGMYPAGFSRHGIQFFRDPMLIQKPDDYNSGVLELLLEATRKAHYPEKPCRYQSMFACGSIEDAMKFRASHGKPSDPIYFVDPQGKVHRGDMSVFAFGQTFAGVDHRLHLYWRGETLQIAGYEPKWEYVLELPVMMGKKVEQITGKP